jgi:hypothetical protein
MQSLNDHVNEYIKQLKKGQIQKAYKGIMNFMSALKSHMETKHPDYVASALYFGYMDMTYFAFTPMQLKQRSLKIAMVYLHEENRFEVWLGGSNRKIQTQYIERFKNMDIGNYKLSEAFPGVDSIIEGKMVEQPNFEESEALMQNIERKMVEFTQDILSMLTD